MPLSAYLGPTATRKQRIPPKTARLVVVVVGTLVAALDLVTPAHFQINVLYGLVIATCAWSASRRFLWTVTIVVAVVAILATLQRAPATVDWSTLRINLALATFRLLVIAFLVAQWMKEIGAVEVERSLSSRLIHTLDLAQVIIRKLDGTVLFWSHGAERLYGWTSDETVGKTTHEVLRTQFEDTQRSESEQRLQKTGEWIGELCQSCKDGSTVWIASHWTLHENGLFHFPVVTEVNNDVTALKLAETRFRDLTQVIPHLVWEVSPEGRTTFVNERWREYFHREPSQVNANTTLSDFVHPDDVQQTKERWQKALRSGVMEAWEVRYRRHDGVYRWFLGRATLVRDNAGVIRYWIATATDIEEQKKTMERLRETQKLESIGRLASGVAHDFNNVLTAISGYAAMLNEAFSELPAAVTYLAEIDKAAARAAALTAQLLSFSRPQLPKPRIVNLNTLLSDIGKMVGRVIGEDIELSLHLTSDLPNVVADPVQVDQIVMNLAVNARDAMPTGGTLLIETGTIMVDEEDATKCGIAVGTYVTLTARDSGVGMDQETKARLFEPFFTTKERDKGTGLGLSIIFGIVQQAHGFITVESAVGAGAAFTISLPASGELEVVQSETATERNGRGDGVTVLLVEDEDSVRHLVAAVLRDSGYRVLEAATPKTGLEIARKYPGEIGLLVTDVLMPEMRGPELVDAVRLTRPGVAVLYMSGYSDSTFLNPTMLDGASYIQKPFRPAKLTAMVSAVLQARSTGERS